MDSDGWARKTAGPQAVPTSIGSPVLKTSSTPAPTVCVPSVIPPPFLNRPTVVANVVGICRMDARRGGGSGSVFALSSQLSSRHPRLQVCVCVCVCVCVYNIRIYMYVIHYTSGY